MIWKVARLVESHRVLGQAFGYNLVSRLPVTIGLKQENMKWLRSGESGCPFSNCSRYVVGESQATNKKLSKKFFAVFGSKFCQGMFFPFQNAMRVIGLSSEQINDVHLVLASILQLGNISFITTGGAQVQDKNGRCY